MQIQINADHNLNGHSAPRAKLGSVIEHSLGRGVQASDVLATATQPTHSTREPAPLDPTDISFIRFPVKQKP